MLFNAFPKNITQKNEYKQILFNVENIHFFINKNCKKNVNFLGSNYFSYYIFFLIIIEGIYWKTTKQQKNKNLKKSKS